MMSTNKRPRNLKTDAEIMAALEEPSDREGEDEGLDDSLSSIEADGGLGDDGRLSDISDEDSMGSEPIPSTSTATPCVPAATLHDSLCKWNRVSNVGDQGHCELDSIHTFTGQHSISGFENLT